MDAFPADYEKELVIQLRKGEVNAFDILFDKYSSRLYRFSFSLLKNEEEAKDIVQETFCRIWDKRQTIDSHKSFKTYLFTISYHLIIDQLRLNLKDLRYRGYLKEYFHSVNDFIENSIDQAALNKQISVAIEEIPEKRKRIFILSRNSGMSNKEIARQLNISVKTVENQINLALRHLKFRIGKDVV